MNKKIRVGIVTGARSEYGLLRPVFRALAREARCEPYFFVTGMHLLPKFGSSVDLITEKIAARVPMYDSATPLSHAARGLTRAFAKHKLEYVVLLGDRKEMLAGAVAAFDLGIPIVHIHGGDSSLSGHQDEVIRPIISKFASLHFAASAQSAKRLLRLGEDKERIYVSGSPALDAVRELHLLSAKEVRSTLGIVNKRYAVVMFHPNDREADRAGEHVRTILDAVYDRGVRSVLAVYPNNDRGHEAVISAIESYRGKRDFVIARTLAPHVYVSALKHAEFLIGNSSGGIYECSYLQVPAINVGARNRGREHANNIVFVEPNPRAIRDAIQKTQRPSFWKKMERDRHHFGNGRAGAYIAKTLRSLHLSKEELLQKAPVQ